MIIDKIVYDDEKGYFEVLMETGKVFHISYECLERFQLKPELDLDGETLSIIEDEENYFQGRSKALSYIAYRQRSRQELENYLYGKKFDDTVIERILENLEQLKLIDDEAFAKAFVRDKTNLNQWGPIRLSYELKRRGVEDRIIDKAINNIPRETYVDLALKSVQRKIKQWDKLEPFKRRQKIYSHLSYRGFDYDIIQIVMEELDHHV